MTEETRPTKTAAGEMEPPPAPRTLGETGLHPDSLLQLVVKTLYGGEATGTQLADRLALPYSVFENLVDHVRAEKLVEVRGTNGTGTAGYRYALTDLGRERARQFQEVSQYVGPAPVPLDQYVAAMLEMSKGRPPVDRARVIEGFSHLVVSPAILDQLGPAINSGKSIFLYGPPGNGKTVIAEGIGRARGGELFVPHALDVDGQVIKMYDPVNHEIAEREDLTSRLLSGTPRDRRWVRVKRPVITAGGELTLDMLDLSFNPIARFYEAPIQLKANGGVFVVDDFGRQRIRPRDLLNRWIVPLESRVDYLTLHTGKKFQVPFDVLIVFATNLKPETLADEAFLRRIPYKIFAKSPTVDEFSRIFEMNCARLGLTFDPVIIEYLQRRYYAPRAIEMRACQPRDLLNHIVDLAMYRNRPPVISRELLDAACTSYFLDSQTRRADRRSSVNGAGSEEDEESSRDDRRYEHGSARRVRA